MADEESLPVRGYLHRDDNCVTRIHYCITRFGPQGLQCNKVQLLDLHQSLILMHFIYDLQNQNACEASLIRVELMKAYTFSSGSSKADDLIEP